MRVARVLPLFVAITLTAVAQPAKPKEDADEARLLRFPAIHGDRIAFTYAGDLYTVPAAGGVARRLTSHDGFEMFPRFSPDGKWLAFTGQYDGNTEVFLMPADGGEPKRLTYTATLGRDDVSDRMGPNNIVMGWRRDGRHIVFRSRMREHNDFIGQLFQVSVDGELPEQIPVPRGGFCSFSPDDKKMAYNRVFREFRTWKRYRGGMADDVWVYDFETKRTESISPTPAQDIIPMWHGDRIYFVSDRDESQRMNLFVYDTKTKQTRQLTRFQDYDIKFPSLGDKAIVFEYAGYIYRFDLAAERAEKVPVQIHEDRLGGRAALVNVSKNVTSFGLSPDGKRAVLGARGEVFTVPAQSGPTRNLTNTPGVHEREAAWSPDGRLIAYLSDQSGEDEVWVRPADGSGEPVQLTTGGDTYKYTLDWSPDSKKIAWNDKKLRLQYVDVASKTVKLVVQARAWEITQFAWSPDSKWLAYAKPETEGMPKVYLYGLDTDKTHEVTDGWHASSQPAFSGDGKYLFFVSNRDFNPTFGQTEWNHIYQDMARIYLVTLAKETESPFKPKNDEPATEAKKEEPKKDEPKKDEPKKDEAKKEEGKKEPPAIKVDPDGLKERVLQVPVQPSSYFGLQSVGSTVYYLRRGTKDNAPMLFLYDLAARKETNLGQINAYDISADKKKMIVNKDGNYAIIDLPKGPITVGETLNVSGMEMKLDRHAEWRQVFNECWRQMRDFFYAPNLHGVDWPAVRKKYEPLLAHVNHRADLTYVIGEMIGELNVGHAYVGGGEMPRPQRLQTGLLGAELKRDPASKFYQITRILPGSSWDPSLRSPLRELGVNVKEGDYLIAINGRPTSTMNNPFEALVNTAGKQVALKVNSEPREQGARTVTVVPISDEHNLYYHAWVQGNIEKVAKATDGKVGYLHVPDMLPPGLNEFVKYYYPQLRKKALIIDVRGNGGGNVSPMLIERLRREIAMINIARNGAPVPNPEAMVWGPKVCLMNEFSASDGDLFPYQFKHYKLGKLIGKRSWGGVVGIRGTLPLLDGGTLNRPEFSRYDVEGKEWVIEGHGVDPDIVVDNDPAREFAGEDQQLNKAIEVILDELKTQEKKVPPPPPLPNKAAPKP
jgi:tricorn protease